MLQLSQCTHTHKAFRCPPYSPLPARPYCHSRHCRPCRSSSEQPQEPATPSPPQQQHGDSKPKPAINTPGPYELQTSQGIGVGPAATAFFQLLSFCFAGAAVASVALTPRIIKALQADPATASASILCAAATLLPICAAHHCLKEAAATQSMGTQLADALNGAVGLHSVLGLVILAQAASLRTPPFTAVVGTLFALSALVSFYVSRVVQLQQGRLSSWDALLPLITTVSEATRGAVTGVRSLVEGPPSLTSVTYAALSVCSLGFSVFLMSASPDARNPLLGSVASSSLEVYTARMAGAGLAATGIICGALKACADRELLLSPLPRLLGTVIAASSALLAGGLLWSGVRSLSLSFTAAAFTAVALWTAACALFPPPHPSPAASRVILKLDSRNAGLSSKELQATAAQALRESSPALAFRCTALPADAFAAY